MFRHTESKECKFGGKCRIKLCQFQHNAVEETAEQIDNLKCEMCDFETSIGQKLDEHKESIHQYEKFDALEEWEKYEVNDYMCDNICWQGDHKCFEKEEENDLIGVDVKKIKDDFRNCVYEERYKCEMCNYQSKTMKQVNTHFLDKHKTDYKVNCWECDKELKTISELRKHVGTFHYTLKSESEN